MKKIGKTMNPNSPYAQLVKVREANRKSMVRSGSVAPDEVAKVILKAITLPNPDIRYVVGHDAARLLESKSSMPDNDKEFLWKIQNQDIEVIVYSSHLICRTLQLFFTVSALESSFFIIYKKIVKLKYSTL